MDIKSEIYKLYNTNNFVCFRLNIQLFFREKINKIYVVTTKHTSTNLHYTNDDSTAKDLRLIKNLRYLVLKSSCKKFLECIYIYSSTKLLTIIIGFNSIRRTRPCSLCCVECAFEKVMQYGYTICIAYPSMARRCIPYPYNYVLNVTIECIVNKLFY